MCVFLRSFVNNESRQLLFKKITGPILAIYCVRLSHAITCPLSKYCQILYMFPQIVRYFLLFQRFFSLF